MEITDLFVCQDCLLAIANGEPMEDEAREAALTAYELSLPAGSYLVAGDSEKDIGFSSISCPTCGCGLAGSRHHVVEVS